MNSFGGARYFETKKVFEITQVFYVKSRMKKVFDNSNFRERNVRENDIININEKFNEKSWRLLSKQIMIIF